ncbi:MAG: DUF3857 and transglutaminase domain-containing protein [Acidobacteriia bacterium]|nr:DUF3857 and transglutaminase domain-containing protein [Terriglobia bacterium]
MHRPRQLAALVIVLVVVGRTSYAQKTGADDWLPVTPQDLQIKNVPGNSNASALQLYFSYFKNDNENFISVYKRIKILNDAGKKYADVEIEIGPGQSLKTVAARTIHPDGAIVEFKDKPLEKTVLKARGVKYVAKTFTLPEVTVGSIVEVRWTINLPLRTVQSISAWPVQGDLFTLKETLRFRPFQGLVVVPTEWANLSQKSQVSYSYLNQVDMTPLQKKEGNVMQLDLENVPAFYSEEYMPPHDDYRQVVLFYYGGRETASPEKYWEEWRRLGTQYIDKFIGNFHEIRELAEQTMAGETDPEKKLRKLYARAQQVRNLSFERARTSTESKKEDLKTNNNALDVLRHGYGTSFDISALFAGMARALGFEAYLLEASDRGDRSFNRLVLWLGQISHDVVLIRTGGKEIVLDPGTRLCPFGALRWRNSSVTALRLSRNYDAFATTPAPEPSRTHRVAKMQLSADGTLKGEITIELSGEDALEHRLEALDTDEAGRRKSWEDELNAGLPNGATVKMADSQGWDATESPLTARFTVEIPSYASVAGKRLVVPAVLFSTLQKNMFTHTMRQYPIVFPYPFSESDEVAIQLPDGYTVEAPPYRRRAGLAYAGYEFSSEVQGQQLSLTRKLRLEGLSFPPEKYPELKGFFGVVQGGDESQAVLRPQEAASPEKSEN